MSLIRLHGVSKSYGRKQILRHVFFRLEKGDCVGLIGPNGAGKTTLLRLVLGRDEPDTGTVQLEDGIGIGYFSQFSELEDDRTIVQVLHALLPQIHQIQAELAQIETRLGEDVAPDEMDKLLARQAGLFLDDTPTHALNVAPLSRDAPRKQVNRMLALMRLV